MDLWRRTAQCGSSSVSNGFLHFRFIFFRRSEALGTKQTSAIDPEHGISRIGRISPPIALQNRKEIFSLYLSRQNFVFGIRDVRSDSVILSLGLSESAFHMQNIHASKYQSKL